MSSGIVAAMFVWMPSNPGGVSSAICSVTAFPQSPPCATYRVVAEPLHQDDPCARDADRVPAGRGRRAREAVTRERGDDHVEGVLRGRAVRRRVGERADDLELLDDRARPAVRDDHRQRALVLASGRG